MAALLLGLRALLLLRRSLLSLDRRAASLLMRLLQQPREQWGSAQPMIPSIVAWQPTSCKQKP